MNEFEGATRVYIRKLVGQKKEINRHLVNPKGHLTLHCIAVFAEDAWLLLARQELYFG
jgi:hypothetical protein